MVRTSHLDSARPGVAAGEPGFGWDHAEALLMSCECQEETRRQLKDPCFQLLQPVVQVLTQPECHGPASWCGPGFADLLHPRRKRPGPLDRTCFFIQHPELPSPGSQAELGT